MQLGELKAEFPFGLLLIKDEGSSETLPEWDSHEEQVTSASTAAVVRVLHGQEGTTTVHVWDNDTGLRGALAFEGRLKTESGILKVSDALGSASIVIPIGSGACRLRVFVSSAVEADHVDLVIEA